VWISGLPAPDSSRSLRQANYPHRWLRKCRLGPTLSYASPKVFCFFFSKKKFFLERKNQRTFAI